MNLTFFGAAGEVTGSCYLIETSGCRLLVDCGMFQGGREARRKNREALGFDPRKIDLVLLSHAHIDHSGLLPRLVALGFRGPIHATGATCDLLAVMLLDAAYIQEKEAERENRERHRSRRRGEAAPLYTVAQAQECLRRLQPVDYDAAFEPRPGVRCRFRDAGHILGAAIVELWLTARGAARKIVFSGDIGQPGRPVVRDPSVIAEADVLLVESTYGNRLHKSLPASEEEIALAVNGTLDRGNLIVPAFAVGRTQEILYVLGDLVRRGSIPAEIAIYVDSPMATRATEITLRHAELMDAESRALFARHARDGGNGPHIRFTESTEDSMRLNALRSGAIIISASGMCDAGRIKYHLQYNLPRPESAILITGFQAAGTLGRRLVDGARTVRLFGDEVPVRARIHTIGGLSAHADRDALLGWLARFRRAPRATWVVHGEPLAAHALRDEIERRLGWRASVPAPGQSVALEA